MSTGRKRALKAFGLAAAVWFVWSGWAGKLTNMGMARISGPEYLCDAIRADRYDRACYYVNAGRPLDQAVLPGKSIQGLGAAYGHGRQPLVEACRTYKLEFAFLLLKHGAKATVVDSDGRTPLHAACENGDALLVPKLIAMGADVNHQDSEGMTPLDMLFWQARGAEFKGEALRAMLLAGAKFHNPCPYGLDHDEPPVILDDPYGTALIQGIRYSGEQDFQWLLEHGANPNVISPKSGDPILVSILRKGKEMMLPDRLVPVKLLLEHGAKVDLPGRDGKTALHLACENHATAVAELLLKHGANPNAKDKNGKTPLDLVVPIEEVLK